MSQRTESSQLHGVPPGEEGWARGGRLPGEGIMGGSVGKVVDSGLVQAGETAGAQSWANQAGSGQRERRGSERPKAHPVGPGEPAEDIRLRA